MAEPKHDLSNNTIQSLMNTPFHGIMIIKPDGEILSINQVMAARFGKDTAYLHGKNAYDFIHADMEGLRRAAVNRVIETGLPYRFEAHHLDSEEEFTIYPGFNEKKNINQLIIIVRDTTEQKQAEEELNRSYQTIQALLDSPSDVACVLDLDGTLRLVNNTMAAKYQSRPEDLIGRVLWDFIPEESALIRKRVMEKVRQTGQAVRIEDQGIFALYDSIANPIFNKHGEVVQIAVLARDITDRVRAEQSLRERDLLLKTVIDNAPIFLVAVDQSGVITSAEGAVLNTLGLSPDQLIGQKYLEIENLPDALMEIVALALQGQATYKKFRTNNGLVIETHFFPLQDRLGMQTGLISLGFDVTENHKVQDELRRSKDELQAILDNIDDGIAVMDENNRVNYVNPSELRLTGFQSEKELLDYYSKQDTYLFKNETWESISRQELIEKILIGEFPNPVAIWIEPVDSGKGKWLNYRVIPIRDENGVIQSSILVSTDISESHNAQIMQETAQRDLEQKIAERTAELNQANLELKAHVAESLRAASQAESLARVAAAISAQTELTAILNTVCEETIKIVNYAFCSISLYDEQTDSLRVAAFSPKVTLKGPLPATPRPLFDKYMRALGPAIIVSDVLNLPANIDIDFMAPFGVRTLITIPMLNQAELFGSLSVASIGDVRNPDTSEINLLKALAEQAKVGISKARLFEQVSESRKRLQILSVKLVEIQEQERRSLARELHDEIGQSLTSLRFSLDFMNRALTDGHGPDHRVNHEIQEHLKSAGTTTGQLLERIREISLNLRPAMLDDLGLLPALLALFDSFTNQTNIHVQFKHSGVEHRYPANIETAAFRIIQEALTNAARHAKVQNVSVRLWDDFITLSLQVEDQGVGFDPLSVFQNGQTSGLSGMSERAAACGGTLEIESEPGKGMRLSAEFPLTEEKRI